MDQAVYGRCAEWIPPNKQGVDRKCLPQQWVFDIFMHNSSHRMIALQNIDYIHRKAEVANMSDNSKTSYKPQIYLESHSIIFRHGFEQLGLERIYGGTINKNIPGALERAFNFEIEGIQRKSLFKNGVFNDVTLFAVFKDTINYPDF